MIKFEVTLNLSQFFLLEYNGTMKKIAIVGYSGKMGSMLLKELEPNFKIAKVGRTDNLDDFEGLDLVVDFASHESSLKSAIFCLRKKIPLIIGSTGQSADELKQIDEIAKKIKVVKRANFSRGIELMKSFADLVLNMKPDSIEIIEKHHIHKKDKPSGTALELADYIYLLSGMRAEIKSIREGEEMGEHEIIAWFGDEKLSCKHNVYSRRAFVKGVVEEIKNILKN